MPVRKGLLADLRRTVERFLRAIEADDEAITQEAWEVYRDARRLLGDPVRIYPGGFEGEHFHNYGWMAENGCEVCADYAEEQGDAER